MGGSMDMQTDNVLAGTEVEAPSSGPACPPVPAPRTTFKMELSFDGTAYHGWQRQPNGITVQEVVEEKLYRLFGERERIRIGNDVFIGMGVTVLDGVTIGDGAIIGAGAVVSKDIPPYAIAVGCPIRVVRYRFDEETVRQFLDLKWWDKGDDCLHLVEKHFLHPTEFLKAAQGMG